MSTPQTGGTNRAPWIIAGVLGCLVVCLLLVVVAGGAYFFLFQGKPSQPAVPTSGALSAPTLVPTLVQPTLAEPTLAQRTPSPAFPKPTLVPVVQA